MYYCGMKTPIIVILCIGVPLINFLFYAAIKGFKTYHFATKAERDAQHKELKIKAHEQYLRRETKRQNANASKKS